MARRPTTVELDEDLLNAARAEAAQTGRSESEVIEAALRGHFDQRRPSVVDQVWSRNASDPLAEDEGLALAYEELKAMREERAEADRGTS